MGVTKSCLAANEGKADLSATYQVPDRLSVPPGGEMPFERMNVNDASEDELMTLPGVNRATARNIVQYRVRIGGFRKVEDLALVSGLGAAKLDAIRSEITIGSGSPNQSSAALDQSSNSNGASKNGKRRSLLNLSSLSASQTELIAQVPLTDYASRKLIVPQRSLDNLRVGSWNLQQCTSEKLQNRGVLEVICSTILEQDIALLALQEIGDREAIEKICTELNRPSLKRVSRFLRDLDRAGFATSQWRYVVERTGRMFQSDEYAAFIYDASRVTLRGSSLLDKDARGSERLFTRSPFVCVAEVGNLRLLLCNLHLKCAVLGSAEDAKRNESEIANLLLLVQAVDAFKRTLDFVPHVLLLGDFNADPIDFRFDSLRINGFHCVLAQKEFTNISVKSPNGTHVYDHLWLSPDGVPALGRHCVVRDKLTHPLIPAGWQWNGYVSDHCPVYCQLLTVSAATGDNDMTELRARSSVSAPPPVSPGGTRSLFTLEE